MRSHHGAVTVGDALGGGAVFTLTLPLTQQDSANVGQDSASAREPVTDAAHRFDRRDAERCLDLSPKTADIDVDDETLGDQAATHQLSLAGFVFDQQNAQDASTPGQ